VRVAIVTHQPSREVVRNLHMRDERAFEIDGFALSGNLVSFARLRLNSHETQAAAPQAARWALAAKLTKRDTSEEDNNWSFKVAGGRLLPNSVPVR
jgi:hypothetical protein